MNKDRISRTIRAMEKRNLSQILVTAPASVYYYTGAWIHPGERMLALYISASGDVRLYANRLFALGGTLDTPLAEFDDAEDCVALLAGDMAPGTLGIDKTWPSQFTIRLMQARPDITPVLGSAPVDETRMIKDAQELEWMKVASRMNDQAMSATISAIHGGMTEAELAAEYVAQAGSLGSEGASFDPLVCFGANCAEPHHATSHAALAEGDSVILDLGCLHGRYCSDMTRTVFFGRADDEQRKVYDVVQAANAAGRAVVRPGVPMCEVDRAARKVIEDAGYGKYFIHRTGHGIGLEVHEHPDASSVCPIIAQPGMVFSVEPGIYLPGKFGVRIEDLVAVTEDGCETLNALNREMIVL